MRQLIWTLVGLVALVLDALSEGGAPQQCGRLRDRYGLYWQITPRVLGEMMKDRDRAKAKRAAEAMLDDEAATLTRKKQ